MKSILTRLTILVALIATCSLTALGANTFSDVKSIDWFYDDVTAMADQGVINGYTDGTFRPNAPVTYGEFSTLISKAFLAEELKQQLEIPYALWWEPYMNSLEEAHIWEVEDNKTADTAIERQEVFSAISALLLQDGLSQLFADGIDHFSSPITLVMETGIVQGFSDGDLHLTDTLTRAELATLLSRMGQSKYLEITPYEAPDIYEVETAKGTYNQNLYTVPADFNLDGILTEDEVAEMLVQLQEEFPHNSPLGDAIFPSEGYLPQGTPGYILSDTGIFYISNDLGPGGDCIAWAYYVSDRIYGNLPATYLSPGQWTESDLLPGDIVDSPTHYNIALCHAYAFSNGNYGYRSTDSSSRHIITWLNPDDGQSVGLSVATSTLITRYP